MTQTNNELNFVCNICGTQNRVNLTELDRERRSCTRCGSSVRTRSIVHLLSMTQFNRSLALDDFPSSPQKRGLGLSDWEGYAGKLRKIFDYKTTYFHKEPYLDITSVRSELYGQYDFLISSEVFEHVPPPRFSSFQGGAGIA